MVANSVVPFEQDPRLRDLENSARVCFRQPEKVDEKMDENQGSNICRVQGMYMMNNDLVLAAPQGFEPRYADPESAVLPLNEGATTVLWPIGTDPRGWPKAHNPTCLS